MAHAFTETDETLGDFGGALSSVRRVQFGRHLLESSATRALLFTQLLETVREGVEVRFALSGRLYLAHRVRFVLFM